MKPFDICVVPLQICCVKPQTLWPGWSPDQRYILLVLFLSTFLFVCVR